METTARTSIEPICHNQASPEGTSPEVIVAQKKLNKGRGYRKIRFKAWAPTVDGYAEITCPSDRRRKQANDSHSKPKTAPSKQGFLSENEDLVSVEDIQNSYLCPSPLVKLPANGLRQDPFIELPIKATGCVPVTLDYFITVVNPTDENLPLVPGRLDHHMTLLFPFMLKSAPLFQSIIALCRASILISLGRLPMEDKAVLYHRSKALAAVTEGLGTEECHSDTILLTVSMLLTLEYLSGNPAAVAAHIAGLNKLMALRTDLDDSTPWKAFVKRGLEAYKSLGSFVTGKPPDLPKDSRGFIEEAFAELSLDKPVTYPSLPFNPDLCIVLARLPQGFSELCLSGHISTQSMHILAALGSTTKCCDTETLEEGKLDYELQAMLSALQRLSIMQISPIEKYLACGLVAWSFQLRKLRPLNLFHDPPLRTFIKMMPTQERPDSIREQRCLIWISIAIAGALHLRRIRMPNSHLVLDRLFSLYPVSRDWESLFPILKSFYWTEAIGAHWKKCWDEGIKRWHFVQSRDSLQTPYHPDMIQIGDDSYSDEPDAATLADIAAQMRATPAFLMETFQTAQCPFLQKARQKRNGT